MGFIYSFPRFFEYKTEVQHEKLFLMDNLTEDIEYLVVSNKVLDNRLYHYIVHLSMRRIFNSIMDLFLFFQFSSVQCFSKYSPIIDVIVFQC